MMTYIVYLWQINRVVFSHEENKNKSEIKGIRKKSDNKFHAFLGLLALFSNKHDCIQSTRTGVRVNAVLSKATFKFVTAVFD